MSSDRETMLWKVEPLSPSGTPPLDIDEEWLCFDQKPAILEGSGEESAGLYEEQLTRAQVASKFLEELELKNWVKEESFADWFEEKIDIPIFEELPAPECGQNRAAVIYPGLQKPQPQQQQQQQQQVVQVQPLGHHQQHQQADATQTLLQEFETVLGDVEACHQVSSLVSTLTPPQSPPPSAKQPAQPHHHLVVAPSAHLLVSLQPLHHQTQQAFIYEQQHQQHHQESVAIVSSAPSQQQQQQTESYTVSALPLVQPIDHQIAEHWHAETLSLVPLVHGSDVAHELAKVDEYVRSCAAGVAAANVEPAVSSTASRSSLAISSSSSSSSSASSFGSASAPPSPCTSSNASCISSEDSADDPDWCFESTSSAGSGRRASLTGRSGRRAAGSKPYSRPNVEDKRVRKKEQNKNAATRYRQKKKLEVKEILGEERELVNKNDKLQGQLKDLQREIGYLKGLMRDLFRAKGLIK